MASVDHLAEALKVMVDQQNTLLNFLAQLAQQSANSQISNDLIFSEFTEPRDKNWSDVAQFKNLSSSPGTPGSGRSSPKISRVR